MAVALNEVKGPVVAGKARPFACAQEDSPNVEDLNQ
jgi:hypothetical protein